MWERWERREVKGSSRSSTLPTDVLQYVLHPLLILFNDAVKSMCSECVQDMAQIYLHDYFNITLTIPFPLLLPFPHQAPGPELKIQ